MNPVRRPTMAEGILTKQSDEIFNLPLEEYMKVREDRCRNALKFLGLYTVNRDLASMVYGCWYADYYRHKLKTLKEVA